jgi:hypothetical protein
MNCDKFEELFIKESSKELLIHIQRCEECRKEYEKMLRTEKLIKEAKPYFAKEKQKNVFTRIAAGFAILVVSSVFMLQNNLNVGVTRIAYDEAVSSDMPFDEYGLLDIQ